ncbi:MAG: hypothetical protein GY775_05650 [Candidatus Scalindua sp.]|nr:hypothetical protein [Candidatus Scalindua sp.]
MKLFNYCIFVAVLSLVYSSQGAAQQLGECLERIENELNLKGAILLDAREVSFLFIKGKYREYTMKEKGKEEILTFLVEQRHCAIAQFSELKERDREIARKRCAKLKPELLQLLLNHPELDDVYVSFTLQVKAVAPYDLQVDDWLMPEVQKKFRENFHEVLANGGIDSTFEVFPDNLTGGLSLSVKEIIKVMDNPLIITITLIESPIILDK